jgi:small subunit ribosomal protein S8
MDMDIFLGFLIVLSGQGILIISTSLGLMTNKEARRRKLGGEVVCEVF